MIALIALVTGLAFQGEPVTLRFQPPVGNRYVYDVALKSERKEPSEPNSVMSWDLTLITQVKAQQDGETLIAASSTNSRFCSDFGDEPATKILADEQKKLDDYMAKATRVDLTATIDPFGKVVAKEHATDGFTLGPDPARLFGGMGHFPFFPSQAVSIGSTWKSGDNFSDDFFKMAPAELKIEFTGGTNDLTFKLVSIKTEHGRAIGEIHADGAGGMSVRHSRQGASIDSETVVESHLTTLVDLSTGVPIEAHGTTLRTVKFGGIEGLTTVLDTMSLKLKQ